MWSWNCKVQINMSKTLVIHTLSLFSSLKLWRPGKRHVTGSKTKVSRPTKSRLWCWEAVKWEPCCKHFKLLYFFVLCVLYMLYYCFFTCQKQVTGNQDTFNGDLCILACCFRKTILYKLCYIFLIGTTDTFGKFLRGIPTKWLELYHLVHSNITLTHNTVP